MLLCPALSPSILRVQNHHKTFATCFQTSSIVGGSVFLGATIALQLLSAAQNLSILSQSEPTQTGAFERRALPISTSFQHVPSPSPLHPHCSQAVALAGSLVAPIRPSPPPRSFRCSQSSSTWHSALNVISLIRRLSGSTILPPKGLFPPQNC